MALRDTIKKMFDQYDTNKDGSIDHKELLTFLNTVDKELDLPLTTEEQLKNVLGMFDINQDGALELEEIYPVILYVIGLLAGLNKDDLQKLL